MPEWSMQVYQAADISAEEGRPVDILPEVDCRLGKLAQAIALLRTRTSNFVVFLRVIR